MLLLWSAEESPEAHRVTDWLNAQHPNALTVLRVLTFQERPANATGFVLELRGRRIDEEGLKAAEQGSLSPYISHYLCMIGLFCEPTFFVFCRRAAPWRQQARELLEHFRAAGQRRRNVVSVGLVMMPRGLRVAASRVRWARRGHLPRRQDGWQRAPRLGLQDSPRPSRL